jgi:hypothetical protein
MHTQVVSTFLIIFRVASGRAWSNSHDQTEFTSAPGPNITSSTGSASRMGPLRVQRSVSDKRNKSNNDWELGEIEVRIEREMVNENT